jgi:peroxiredoxin
MSSPVYYELRTPSLAVGEPAFDFELPLLDPETHRPTGERVRLADFQGRRPVALVFGSYT